MANITFDITAPKPCKVDAPVYDHYPHGWHAQNSIAVKDCVPVYRNAGGGVVAAYLTTLPEAIDISIAHLNQRIAEAEKLKEQLQSIRLPL